MQIVLFEGCNTTFKNYNPPYTDKVPSTVYQTLFFSSGFIGDPTGQLNSLAKSYELDKVPMTRKRPGEWTAVFSLFLIASGRIAPHHTWGMGD